MPRLLKSELFASLPPEWPTDPFPHIQELVKADGRKIVVLDDDPTGTQTVHGVPVLTEWSVESLVAELRNDLPCFYILTNSRACRCLLRKPSTQALGKTWCRLCAWRSGMLHIEMWC
ncbi:MAG: hypothetical protein HC853_14085 [Anaerolineae bacterium]|nr:hypothetical protein [Anaerolineae bacterium]